MSPEYRRVRHCYVVATDSLTTSAKRSQAAAQLDAVTDRALSAPHPRPRLWVGNLTPIWNGSSTAAPGGEIYYMK